MFWKKIVPDCVIVSEGNELQCVVSWQRAGVESAYFISRGTLADAVCWPSQKENKHIFPLRLLIELGTSPYSIPGRQKVTIRDSFSVVDDESCREFVYEMFKL
ncbi:hypothetical protein CDAR_582601 [Caerostris darwini]|uniref:Uncharacterized protein n=1 Tax=Caerostris darwini TaxID=1538125 RepID=A0AAV4PKZ4_9ARAC|nr:hypothetical protein CDAR_582601 [Caerostris darwini]